jgi:hypothetical protein
LDNSIDFERQLERNVEGKIRTWAIKWQASIFLKQGFCLQPRLSLTKNIGHDGTGENSLKTIKYEAGVADCEIKVRRIAIEEQAGIKKLMHEYYRGIRPGFASKVVGKLRTYLSK